MNTLPEGNLIFMPAPDYLRLVSRIDVIADFIENQKKSDVRLITTEELLNYIPISRSTLQHYRDRNLIRFTKRGRKILYSRWEVIEDLKNMNKL